MDGSQRQLYPWKDDQQWLLQSEPQALNPAQSRLLDQANYRRILREYLLVRDFQKGADT